MSDFQKVRVTFMDADGKGVSAAMWQLPSGGNSAFIRADHENYVGCLSWFNGIDDVTVTPINGLPTGAGAVIRALALGVWAKYGDVRDVYISDQSGVWWSNNDGDVFSKEQIEHDWTFEILSEGIQL